MTLRVDSLVLYKGQPAVVRQVSDKKLTIELIDSQTINVRAKDVILLHQGPSPHPRQLKVPVGDPQTAWEILEGSNTSVAELAELAFGEFTPAAAWAIWQLVADGVYFEGSPDDIIVHSAGKMAQIIAAREAKESEEREWDEFVARVSNNQTFLGDEKYLADVIALALGRSQTSRTLRRLDRPQTPETAHALLLDIGRWLPSDNPYPSRQGITTSQPDQPVAPLSADQRRDLTHLHALAIDDEGSGDPDDAISWDGERLWVHVADGAALVPPDCPADVEARNRAANLYLPEGTIRMLPESVTDTLALGLHPISPALSFAMAPLSDGNFELLEIVPSWIRATRTTYEAAETRLDETPYRELAQLAARNRDRRLANGAVEIELPEVKIRVTIDGMVTIRPLPALTSRLLVREAMLMAGEAAGRFGQDNQVPLAFTVQDSPFEDPNLPTDLTGATPAAMWAQRRLMQRSRPSTSPGRHSGLGLDSYIQVTSPLRRYLDLLAHQQLRAYLRGETPLDNAAITLRIGTAEALAGAVRSTERLSNQHWTIVFLMQHNDWQGEGIVVENKPGRDVILIPELAWETETYGRPSRLLNSVVQLGLDSVDLANRNARFMIRT